MTKRKLKKDLLPVGRPTIMTPDIVSKLENAFAIGCTDIEACLYADISRTTLYEYIQRNPEFADRKEELKQKPILLARDTLVKGIKDNPELALKFLERKLKSEFSLRTELTGADGKDLVKTLDTLENTDYDSLGQEARKQMVALDAPLQD